MIIVSTIFTWVWSNDGRRMEEVWRAGGENYGRKEGMRMDRLIWSAYHAGEVLWRGIRLRDQFVSSSCKLPLASSTKAHAPCGASQRTLVPAHPDGCEEWMGLLPPERHGQRHLEWRGRRQLERYGQRNRQPEDHGGQRQPEGHEQREPEGHGGQRQPEGHEQRQPEGHGGQRQPDRHGGQRQPEEREQREPEGHGRQR